VHVVLTVQLAPPTTAAHAATLCVAPFAPATVSAAHWHANVAGLSVPVVHVSSAALATSVPAHAGTHVPVCSIVAAAPHATEFATVGCVHAFASHTGAAPVVYVSLTSHVYVAGTFTAVYPPRHVAVTVHVPPTAIVAAPHAADVTAAEFATVSASAFVHWQNPGVPLHAPAAEHA